MTHQINRRSALAAVAAVPAVAAISSTALTNTGEDAELLNLWEEWKAQKERVEEAVTLHDETRSKVVHEAGPYWSLVAVKDSPFRAVFASSWHDDVSQKIVPLKAASPEAARSRAVMEQAALAAEREKRERVAERKYNSKATDRAANQAYRRLGEIEKQISEASAEGLVGVAVKLALCKINDDWTQEPVDSLVASAYETILKLAGLPDLAKHVRWT